MKCKPRVTFKPARSPHHLYIGLMIMALGWTMQPWALYGNWDTIFIVAGGLIALDDIVEHTLTGSTPLRLFFDKVIVPFLMRK